MVHGGRAFSSGVEDTAAQVRSRPRIEVDTNGDQLAVHGHGGCRVPLALRNVLPMPDATRIWH